MHAINSYSGEGGGEGRGSTKIQHQLKYEIKPTTTRKEQGQITSCTPPHN